MLCANCACYDKYGILNTGKQQPLSNNALSDQIIPYHDDLRPFSWCIY